MTAYEKVFWQKFFGQVVLTASILVPLIFLITILLSGPSKFPLYKNIPVDPNAEKFGDPISSNSDMSKISLDFNKKIIFNEGIGIINFKNAVDASQTMVLEIFLTESELINKIGRTGRTQEEQSIEKRRPGYDPNTSKVKIALSGSIPPGYNLTNVKLLSLPDGTSLPPEEYGGSILVWLYNVNTGERSMVNSQLDVKIVVK